MKNYELAKKDYESGMKYKDIATKYEVSISTVKSWKARYWKNDEVATKSERVASKKKKVATKKIIDELDETDLTEKQKLFCLYYLQRFNATWAYQKAYEVDYQTANKLGSRLMVNDGVRNEITNLKKQQAIDLYLDSNDILKEYAKQAFADIGDYVDFGSWPEKLTEDGLEKVSNTDKDGNKHEMEIMTSKPVLDDDGNEVILHHSYVYFNDKENVDTSLIKSVHMGKDGPIIELYDKQKAMREILKRYPGNDELLRAQIRKLNAEADIKEEQSKAIKEDGLQVVPLIISAAPTSSDEQVEVNDNGNNADQ